MSRIGTVLVALLLPLVPTAAIAQDDAEVVAGENALLATVQASSDPNAGSSASQASQSNTVILSDPMCLRGTGAGPDVYYGCAEQATCGSDGLLFNLIAVGPTGATPLGTQCVEPDEAAPADVLTPGRILEAFRRVPLPETPLTVQPPGGRTLVNFDTILHTDARPFTESVQLLNRTVEFDIEPSEFRWTLGDGTTLTTTDPGREWREGVPISEYVSHRYTTAGDVDLQLTTTWSARWRVGNGPWRPVQGTVDLTTPAVPLEVTTARPQLISYD